MPEIRRTIGLICSHGGHLTEMLELQPAFEGFEPFYFCYDADTTRRLNHAYLVPNKPYSPIRFAINLVKMWRIISKEKPYILISTGAEIAIPGFLIAKLRGIPTLYIECGAQVTRPSLSGRILIHVADTFYVQWPELLEVYGPKAQCVGSLVDELKGES